MLLFSIVCLLAFLYLLAISFSSPLLSKKITDWDKVAKELIEIEAVSPTPEKLRKIIKETSLSEPRMYIQPQGLIELQFRFSMRRQLAYAYLLDSDTMYLTWAGENPIFTSRLGKYFCLVFLHGETLRLLKEEVLILRKKHEIICHIEGITR